MQTTIEITCNGTVKTQPITHAICRVGSNPSLELCMPGIDDHMATLRVQNGKRHIYNRSPKPITLNGKRLQPQQTMEWTGNQVLELADGVRLRLLSAKDESKVNGSVAIEPVFAGGANGKSQSPPSDQKQRRMAILGFFLVFATILYSSGSDAASKVMDQESSSVIATLTEAETNLHSGRYRQMRVELQNAMLRPDLKEQSLRNIRQILLSPPPESSPAIDMQVQRFVEKYAL